VELGFGGEVAGLYHRYRHGYPAPVLDILQEAFGLTGEDVVIDLGCGTGQLTLPMARRVRAVVGADAEPDMLQRARQAAREASVGNVAWLMGADSDLPVLGALLGDQSVAAVTVAQALHWMDRKQLFRAVIPLLRRGGGVAVVTNGTPLWLQDSDWSRALRAFLERWLGTALTSDCGTSQQSQLQYRHDLAAAGYRVASAAIDYNTELDLDQLIGGIYSALPVTGLPRPEQRPAFAGQLRAALGSHEHFSEPVHVAILLGTIE
jgi:trans-aconitate methyltransferase